MITPGCEECSEGNEKRNRGGVILTQRVRAVGQSAMKRELRGKGQGTGPGLLGGERSVWLVKIDGEGSWFQLRQSPGWGLTGTSV